MKKRYIAPEVNMVTIGSVLPLAASGVTTDRGIGYGGVDEEGTLDPSSRRGHNVWDEVEDEADE